MLLPITINGLGTSQAAFVWFFSARRRVVGRRLRPVGALRRARHRRQPAGRRALRGRLPRAGRASHDAMNASPPAPHRGVPAVQPDRRGRRRRGGARGGHGRAVAGGRDASQRPRPVSTGLPALQSVDHPIRAGLRAVRSGPHLPPQTRPVLVRQRRIQHRAARQHCGPARRRGRSRGAGRDRAGRFLRDGLGGAAGRDPGARARPRRRG